MQHRYSRGQSGSGQGSLPRPAWNSGNHGTRTASPEPGANANGTPLGGGSEATKAREERPDDVIAQLENEVSALSNACAAKDQRIAELTRTDTLVGRLKRDVRLLAAELHATRKQLSESVSEQEKLKSQSSSGKLGSASGLDGAAAANEVVDSPSGGNSGADTGVSILERERHLKEMMERFSLVEEENRQLKEALAQTRIAAPSREQSNDNVLHTRQSSGASTQRVSELASQQQQQQHGGMTAGYRGSDPLAARYVVGQHGFAGHAPAPLGGLVTPGGQREEPVRAVLYSSHNLDNAMTLGPTMVEGVGTVDGVASVAKLVLQRCRSSVYCPQQQVAAGMGRGQVLA